MKNKNSIDFVSRHYRRNAFDVAEGWKRLGIKRFRWSAFKVAASVGALIAVSATAAILFKEFRQPETTTPEKPETVPTETASPLMAVKAIDFDNTPLPEVLRKIEATYSVRVVNLPDDAESIRLSLHYTGNAVDLVETINELLETELTVEQ
ncbi:MAG: DUF4974 domain-containing protein [Muribaculaceae bacterium]|nr:DUF4974 domain-containing protein [Muribaculaceae bacterium]